MCTLRAMADEELRQMCENTLHLLVTTQEPMEDLFWPLLLRSSTEPVYTRAGGVIAKALAHLVTKKKNDPCPGNFIIQSISIFF